MRGISTEVARTAPPVTCTTPLPAKSRTPHPNSGVAPLEAWPRPAENMPSSLHTQCTISGSENRKKMFCRVSVNGEATHDTRRLGWQCRHRDASRDDEHVKTLRRTAKVRYASRRIRCATAPLTIVAAVETNAHWKSQCAFSMLFTGEDGRAARSGI